MNMKRRAAPLQTSSLDGRGTLTHKVRGDPYNRFPNRRLKDKDLARILNRLETPDLEVPTNRNGENKTEPQGHQRAPKKPKLGRLKVGLVCG